MTPWKLLISLPPLSWIISRRIQTYSHHLSLSFLFAALLVFSHYFTKLWKSLTLYLHLCLSPSPSLSHLCLCPPPFIPFVHIPLAPTTHFSLSHQCQWIQIHAQTDGFEYSRTDFLKLIPDPSKNQSCSEPKLN